MPHFPTAWDIVGIRELSTDAQQSSPDHFPDLDSNLNMGSSILICTIYFYFIFGAFKEMINLKIEFTYLYSLSHVYILKTKFT